MAALGRLTVFLVAGAEGGNEGRRVKGEGGKLGIPGMDKSVRNLFGLLFVYMFGRVDKIKRMR